MAAVVNTFLYSGTLRQVVIPAGTQSIDVHLWGGAGGGGGSDAGGPGGTDGKRVVSLRTLPLSGGEYAGGGTDGCLGRLSGGESDAGGTDGGLGLSRFARTISRSSSK